jgi:hypothetical protein
MFQFVAVIHQFLKPAKEGKKGNFMQRTNEKHDMFFICRDCIIYL